LGERASKRWDLSGELRAIHACGKLHLLELKILLLLMVGAGQRPGIDDFHLVCHGVVLRDLIETVAESANQAILGFS
jgi:hypothetical protein